MVNMVNTDGKSRCKGLLDCPRTNINRNVRKFHLEDSKLIFKVRILDISSDTAMKFMLQQNCITKLHWKILETFYEIFLTLFFNTLESCLKHLWNCLETPFALLLHTLKLPWIILKGLSELPSINLETSLKDF